MYKGLKTKIKQTNNNKTHLFFLLVASETQAALLKPQYIFTDQQLVSGEKRHIHVGVDGMFPWLTHSFGKWQHFDELACRVQLAAGI